ncbi:amino acid ABC transporter substrate-binding protein [Pokkaliibacter plantistimulans]|uniref:Fe/S biogenesis protein NfuA n=2 Tax=Pseudomonadota TaxID=1224 RepID=A0ABX5M6I1_9GAMM|nr:MULTISPECIES: Fe-S biogenesis protein NfuA [Pokkaliibacter]MDH2435836.1 Fe-S biogenesis protein NfuA [Pokkaliibacter sp. MBI-7]PPC79410.1 Fe/S biogenesis protein NfuA [Pokkaliibacter plantistimulans]PXF33208.1 amino acid ABC transporter substrate-binding protein [Pokkaliibacter plantistimulans]
MLTVTESAQDYLATLLEKQNVEGMAVRIFVTQPGTPYAETCLAYCRPEEVIPTDDVTEYTQFRLYVEPNSLPFLEEAVVDYATDRMGGQLTIKAPNAKMPKVSADSPIEDQINYILYSEINPGLASHGGEVSLVRLEEETSGKVAILKFGGGCQGCSAVDMTLKEGVEKTLIERVAGLVAVRDVTDHTVKENAYYQ